MYTDPAQHIMMTVFRIACICPVKHIPFLTSTGSPNKSHTELHNEKLLHPTSRLRVCLGVQQTSCMQQVHCGARCEVHSNTCCCQRAPTTARTKQRVQAIGTKKVPRPRELKKHETTLEIKKHETTLPCTWVRRHFLVPSSKLILHPKPVAKHRIAHDMTATEWASN